MSDSRLKLIMTKSSAEAWAKRPPRGLDGKLIFVDSLGGIAFCQDGESAPRLTECPGQMYQI
jgi:hypothetical protein